MNAKIKIEIAIGIIVLVAIIVGGAIWIYGNKQQQEQISAQALENNIPVLDSLNSAKEKAMRAAFKADVTSVLPNMMTACYKTNSVTVADLGSPKYFDPKVAIKTLVQDCGPKRAGSFSITINGINEMSAYSAVCTESSGCTVK